MDSRRFAHITDPNSVMSKIKILFTIFIAVIGFSAVGFSYFHKVPFSQGVYMTIETLAFEPPEEVNIIERGLQIFVMVFGSFLVWFALWTILDIIIEGHFYVTIKRWIRMKQVKLLKNHFIIYGGGRVGEHIADLLAYNKQRFVIIENDPERISALSAKKYAVLSGNPEEEIVLKEANIKHAKGLIAVLPLTESNILLTLTAKEMNPHLRVYARASKLNLVNKLRKAGAEFIIMPEYAGAELIVNNIINKKGQSALVKAVV